MGEAKLAIDRSELRFFLPAFIAGLLFGAMLSGCAGKSRAGDIGAGLNTASLLGTWKWDEDGMLSLPQPVYLRCYPRGKVAIWPAPREVSDAAGVLRGRYTVASGHLVVRCPPPLHDVKAKIQIFEDNLLAQTEDGHLLHCKMLDRSLQPGRREDGSPAGFSEFLK